jgi:hypothetical protein
LQKKYKQLIKTLHKFLGIALTTVALLLAMAPKVMAQGNTVFQGQTSELAVVNEAGTTYTWSLFNTAEGVNFATDPENCPPTEAYFVNGISVGASVEVMWLHPGMYFFRVIAVNADGCMNLKVGRIEVLESLPTAFIDDPGDICVGDQAVLVIHFTGNPPWNFILEANDGDQITTTTYTNIGNSPIVLDVSPTQTTTYRVIEVSDTNGVNTTPSNTVTLIVKPKPISSPIYQYEPQAKKK